MEVNTHEDTISNIASYYGVDGQKLQRHYKHVVSRFKEWQQLSHAESFNSKIKRFRANLRGVSDVKFFLFRLEKLFA